MNNLSKSSASTKMIELHENELTSVSGGHPAVIVVVTAYGGYEFGREVGKGIKKAWSWVKDKLSEEEP
ncbi:hypothetical protein [Rheinheimera sp. UJ63]|uniref:hypothetical protein n=1 Tax=Rheinheimera sp. UJ63 TaxID=2910157 RepID=UPI001F1F974B|nr:hypothetical protein [Rheinheimera sp. UJ63]MCF4008455.1 hypothetical protein [Rheinheimera sp. UJ63]